MFKLGILKLIRFYKKFISRGYYCRMVPSCSEYLYQAVEKYGVIKGGWLGLKRISKCHPWGRSGVHLLK